jgi:uncharacterized spore protein YtfJ
MNEMNEKEMYQAGQQALETTASSFDRNMEKFLSTADVRSAYGEPVVHGDVLLIPTAEVLSAVGFGLGGGVGGGMGAGSSENQESSAPAQNGGGGGGGGGAGAGGSVISRPVAVIIASPEGVRVEPVVDITKIAIAALTAFGMMAGMAWRMGRRSR